MRTRTLSGTVVSLGLPRTGVASCNGHATTLGVSRAATLFLREVRAEQSPRHRLGSSSRAAVNSSRCGARSFSAVTAWSVSLAPTGRRLPALAIVAACLLAAGPLVVLAVRLLAGPALTWAGDQALVELGIREAGAFHRSLGVYSRFGWNHPGPVWLYLLAGPYRLLGGDGRALGAAVAASHGLCAVLIVACAARLRSASRHSAGAGRAFAAAVAVLVLQHAFGRSAFFSPWNPLAVVLPALLFLLLAAGVLLRRRGWLVGAVAAATFLVQTHIGTVPLVVVVGGLVLLVRAVARLSTGHRLGRRRRSVDEPAPCLLSRVWPTRLLPGTGLGRVQAGGWLLIVLAWLPPLLEQEFAGGNLGRIGHFVTTSRHATSWRASASVAGELLYRSLLSRARGRLSLPLPPTGGLMMLVLCAGAGVLLGAVGYALQEPVSRACAAVSVAGIAAGVLAAHQTVGGHDPYLLFWLAAVMAPLTVGTAALLASVPRRGAPAAGAPATPSTRLRHRGAVARPAGVLALAVGGVVLAAPLLGGIKAKELSNAGNSRPVAAELSAVERWLGPQRGALLIRIVSHRVWPQVAGLLLRLRANGHPTYVTANWVSVFGAHQRLPAPTSLVLDAAARGTPRIAPPAGVQLGTGRFDVVQLTLVRARVPASPQTVPQEGP